MHSSVGLPFSILWYPMESSMYVTEPAPYVASEISTSSWFPADWESLALTTRSPPPTFSRPGTQ